MKKRLGYVINDEKKTLRLSNSNFEISKMFYRIRKKFFGIGVGLQTKKKVMRFRSLHQIKLQPYFKVIKNKLTDRVKCFRVLAIEFVSCFSASESEYQRQWLQMANERQRNWLFSND